MWTGSSLLEGVASAWHPLGSLAASFSHDHQEGCVVFGHDGCGHLLVVGVASGVVVGSGSRDCCLGWEAHRCVRGEGGRGRGEEGGRAQEDGMHMD